MGIYVACNCGQAFSARPDLAGQTLQCPACGGPILVPRPQPTSSLTPLPAGSYVVPQPTVIRQPIAPTTSTFPDPLGKNVASQPASEGLPPAVFIASIAAGSVLLVLLCVIGVQQVISRMPASQPATVSAPPAQNPAPVIQQTVQPPAAVVRAAMPGWTRVDVVEGRVSVEFPPGSMEGVSREREGIVTRGRMYTNGSRPTLVVAHFKGSKVGEAADDLNKFAELTGSIALGTQPMRKKVQGYNAIEVISQHFTGYARHQFIFIAEDEMLLISGTAEYPTTRAEAEYFVDSLRIKQPSVLDSLLPKFRWPLSSGSN